jgi:hypothetical protein
MGTPGINSFGQGLNQDNSRSKYSPQNYYYLLNGKIVTESGLSSGSATNKKGNSISFSIPATMPVYEILVPEDYSGTSSILVTISTGSVTIPITGQSSETIYNEIYNDATIQTYITAGYINVFLNADRIVIVGLNDLISVTLNYGGLTFNTIATSFTDLEICGWENLENKLIVFTTNEISDSPTNAPGQIWELEYNEETEEIIGIVGGLLVPSIHLKYNNKLNLSMSNRVGKIIGRYENSKIRRVYWTDNYNLLRTFNLADADGLALPPTELDIRADVNLSVPIIESIGVGSITIGCTVQYGYRLKSIGGADTIISPLSPPTPLGGDPNANYEDFKGSAYNQGDARSVTYRIKNLDTSYSLIEHIVVIYEHLDVPQVFIFKEEFIPLNGELLVTHDGSEDYQQLTLQEFNVLNHPFRCKSIAAKRNKLLAANINYNKVKVDYDARAFRFNNISGNADLYDKQGSIELTITPANLATIAIAETLDCINPYNDESGTIYNTLPAQNPTNWESSYQYKYQSDGSTLGGEGKNVSYTFLSTDTFGYNGNPTAGVPHINTSRNNNNIVTGTEEVIENNNYFGDFKSPLISTYLKGYKRGEVYRFGVVFFDKKGTPSMVNWIGDIRFPECSEFEDFGSVSPLNTAALDTKQIGIRFVLDISSVQSSISGFSIVRLEREETDKTRLGTGIPIGLTNNVIDNYTALEDLFDGNYTQQIQIDSLSSNEQESVYYIQDYPGETAFDALFTTIFPFHQYDNKFTFKTNDYLKEAGLYNTQPYCTYYDSNNDKTIGVYNQGRIYTALTTYNRYLINEVVTLGYKEYKIANTLFGYSLDENVIVNTSFSRDDTPDKYTPLGFGNKKLITTIDNSPPLGFSNSIKNNWANGIYSSGNTISQGTTLGPDFNIKIVDYCRFLLNQYGGASYESRASNTYISTGHYSSIDNTSSASQVGVVYGGDIYTVYYSDEYITMHWETGGNQYPYNDVPTKSKLSVAVGFPCETHVNFNYRHGNTFADNQDYSGNWTQTPYDYNQVYHQNPNAVQQYISPAIIDTDTDEHAHQIIASQEKIDGEAFDAWRIFSPNDLIDVNGNHGDINEILTYRDKVFFFQTRAIGVVSVQDRSTTQDTTGSEIVLGTGGILDFYQYISTNTGCFHQFSVVPGTNGIYFIDTLSRKAMLLSEGEAPLSTIEGMSSFFDTSLQGEIQTIDKTLWYNTMASIGNPAVGVHGVYDRRNHCVIWTILKGEIETLIDRETGLGYFNWNSDASVSIVYNELMQSFEEFSSATPRLWLDNYRRLLSTDPTNLKDVYLHNTGTRGEFYKDLYDFKITIVVNSHPELTKILDSLEYLMDLKTSSGVDIPDETFNTIRVYNSYQDTGTLTLIPQSNVVRRLRKWRINVLRDDDINKPRLRDYHFFVELTYNNNADKELILHDLIHYIRPSNF